MEVVERRAKQNLRKQPRQVDLLLLLNWDVHRMAFELIAAESYSSFSPSIHQ